MVSEILPRNSKVEPDTAHVGNWATRNEGMYKGQSGGKGEILGNS